MMMSSENCGFKISVDHSNRVATIKLPRSQVLQGSEWKIKIESTDDDDLLKNFLSIHFPNFKIEGSPSNVRIKGERFVFPFCNNCGSPLSQDLYGNHHCEQCGIRCVLDDDIQWISGGKRITADEAKKILDEYETK